MENVVKINVSGNCPGFSKDEADTVLEGVSGNTIFSNCVKIIQKKRKKKNLSDEDKEIIFGQCSFLSDVAFKASRNVFCNVVPESEITCWLSYAVSEFKRMATDPHWIATGELEQHDASIFPVCSSILEYPVAVALAFESKLFHALGTFVKARKSAGNLLPSEDISQWVICIVVSAFKVATLKVDNKWHPPEGFFEKFESSGILEQFLRCCGTFSEDIDSHLIHFLNELQSCVSFLHKSFKKGQPCGDVLIAILQGKYGSQVKRPTVFSRLQAISRLVEAIGMSKKENTKMTKSCHHCNKSDSSDAFQASLMKCARCKITFYCSKECQRADWKLHKGTCMPAGTKPQMKHVENMETVVKIFARKFYILVMIKMVEACKGTDLKKKDVLVELDYTANKDGFVPALQEPPIFTVVPTQDYINSSRTNWFGRRIDPQSHKQYVAAIRNTHHKMTSRNLLLLVNFNGTIACWKMDVQGMYTDELFEAFQIAIIDKDLGPLKRIMNPQYFEFVQAWLMCSYGIGALDGGS